MGALSGCLHILIESSSIWGPYVGPSIFGNSCMPCLSDMPQHTGDVYVVYKVSSLIKVCWALWVFLPGGSPTHPGLSSTPSRTQVSEM